MNKIISILVSVTVLAGILCVPLSTKAVEVSTTSLEEFIQLLKQQIEALRAKILELQEDLVSLKDAKKEVKEVTKEIKETIRINKRLWRGMSNEDVRLLQEVLATDPEIYPEGLITGYFGPLTERAVKRFQKKMGVEQVGLVGPKTLAKINELLTEGAGSSGKVPPGLLIAPGIKKKISFVPQPLPGQELPPGIAKKLEVDSYQFIVPKPYPNTPLYDWLVEEKCLDENGQVNYSELSHEDICKWTRTAMKECFFRWGYIKRILSNPLSSS